MPTEIDEERLLQHVGRGGVLEDGESMSPGYRRELTKMLRIAGDTELRSVPMIMSYFDIGVPQRYVRPLLSLVQDELAHAHLDYRLLEDLGGDVTGLIYQRPAAEWTSPYLFGMPIETWAEATVVEGLGEYAGGLLVHNIRNGTSYAPWQRALGRVVADEKFHARFGRALMEDEAGTTAGRARLQAAVDWMFPLLVEFMGPPSRTHDRQLDYRLKAATVDDLRQDYLAFAVPLCWDLGLEVPAHQDANSGSFVLDFPFPCAFDVANKRWNIDEPVEWQQVYERWRALPPRAEEHVAWLQACSDLAVTRAR